jgi:phosphoribosyl-AMP cyclohydrolase
MMMTATENVAPAAAQAAADSAPTPEDTTTVGTVLNYDESGLIPTIIQQYDSGEVLMMAYMNAEALARTRASGTTWFWSRSRRSLWNKGETSGNTQQVKGIFYDCDADCLLVKVDSPGPACHTGNRSCFYREV